MKLPLHLVFLYCFVLFLAYSISGQIPSTQEEKFGSLDGLYSLTIPTEVRVGGGGRLEDYFISGFGSSYSRYWLGDHIYLQAGHVTYSEDEKILTEPQKTKIFETLITRIRDRYKPDVNLTRTDQIVNGIPVADLFYVNTNGEKVLFRLYSTEVGVVRLYASSMPGKPTELATRFLASIGRQTRSQMIAHKLAEATPDELPACGKEIQYPTDLEIEGLKGKVKSISHFETEEDQGKQIRSLRSTRDYGLDGRLRLVLRFEFNRPDTGTAYGCIGGRRVSNWRAANYENRLFGGSGAPPGDEPADKRFETAYESVRNSNGRIDELHTYSNTRALTSIEKYSYEAGHLEVTTTNFKGRLAEKVRKVFDDKFRLVSAVEQDFWDDGNEWKRTYVVLKHDPNGNWIERESKSENFKNDKLERTFKSIEIREIVYY